MRRHHAQLINELGIPESMEKTFPVTKVMPDYVIATDSKVSA